MFASQCPNVLLNGIGKEYLIVLYTHCSGGTSAGHPNNRYVHQIHVLLCLMVELQDTCRRDTQCMSHNHHEHLPLGESGMVINLLITKEK